MSQLEPEPLPLLMSGVAVVGAVATASVRAFFAGLAVVGDW